MQFPLGIFDGKSMRKGLEIRRGNIDEGEATEFIGLSGLLYRPGTNGASTVEKNLQRVFAKWSHSPLFYIQLSRVPPGALFSNSG
jgi:hypothetical protein